MSGARRVATLAVLVAVLVAGGMADRIGRPATEGSADDVETQVPYAAPAAAGSSAWFCAGGTAAPGSPGDATVVVANTTGERLDGTATVVPVDAAARSVPITVDARDRTAVRLGDVASAPWASAVVELDGGGAVVELVASGPLGESITPCASSASATWYFAEGATSKDASLTLAVLNPFPDDAVVDFLFSTEEGQFTPPRLTGVTVAGRSMAAIPVGELVERREAVATIVRARTGRLAVGRLQTWDGSAGRRGVTIAMGAAAAGSVWYFPEGLVAEGLAERFQLFNPTADEAEVELSLTLETGSAEPLNLRIPARSRLTVSANDETRIPRGVAHAVTVTSSNGVGVVAERTVEAAAPSPRRGVASTFGARPLARSWATAAGGTAPGLETIIVVQNPSNQLRRVDVVALVDGSELRPDGLRALEVPARSRRAIPVGAHLQRPDTALIVRADGPVVVERDLHRAAPPPNGRGPVASSAMSMAIPMRERMAA